MSTVADIVTAALRLIGVVAEDEPASGEAMQSGVAALNRMLHGWKAAGVDVSHTDQTSSDTFQLGAEYEEATIRLLGERLALENGVPLPYRTASSWARIWGGLGTHSEVTMPSALKAMPSQRRLDYTSPD